VNEPTDNDVVNILAEVEPIAKDIAKLLIERTGGSGGKVMMTLAAVLGYLETQHEGTIDDVSEASVLLANNYRRNAAKLNIHPGGDGIN
jgi:hypothetical protein